MNVQQTEVTSLTDDARPSAPTTDVQTVEAVCERCTRQFSYVPILFSGREVARQRWCQGCVEADKERIQRGEALQAGHVNNLKALDRETTLKKFMHDAGINSWEHGTSTFENFDTTESGPEPRGRARQFAEAVKEAGAFDPVRGFYVWGGTGSGKTHLAVAVVRELLEADYLPRRIVFDHAAELVARIQDTYGRKNASTFDVLESRFDTGLWVLDDLGTERASDDVVRHLTLIFARRAQRPTLITSNLSPVRMEAERPELMRVLSRLGPKYFRVCEVKGRDRRFD